MNSEDYLELAMRIAKNSAYHQKLGCVIVKRNRIVGLGFNKPYKTHPKSNTPFKNIHAELDAMLGVHYRDLIGATAYIARQHKNGDAALAKPCNFCMELLHKANVRRVIWTTSMNDKGDWFKELIID